MTNSESGKEVGTKLFKDTECWRIKLSEQRSAAGPKHVDYHERCVASLWGSTRVYAHPAHLYCNFRKDLARSPYAPCA